MQVYIFTPTHAHRTSATFRNSEADDQESDKQKSTRYGLLCQQSSRLGWHYSALVRSKQSHKRLTLATSQRSDASLLVKRQSSASKWPNFPESPLSRTEGFRPMHQLISKMAMLCWSGGRWAEKNPLSVSDLSHNSLLCIRMDICVGKS